LLKKRELLLAEKENRNPKVLTESDYLLGIDDFSRMGAIRFSLEKGGPFMNDSKELSTPPVARLREVESISLEYENDNIKENSKWIKMLVNPGSSLGGARPKANVIDLDVGAWEFVVHELAIKCGLNVPEAKIVKFSKYGTTYLTKRFDRIGTRRIYFASTMTLLGKLDGESGECSYLDIVKFINQYGISPKTDLLELWKRIVFSIAVKNTDDHLRNHGFIVCNNGWKLSPMFDVNANPDGLSLSLNIDEFDNSLSFELALDTVKYYGLSKEDGKKIIDSIKNIINQNWERIARDNKISETSIKYMKRAFDN